MIGMSLEGRGVEVAAGTVIVIVIVAVTVTETATATATEIETVIETVIVIVTVIVKGTEIVDGHPKSLRDQGVETEMEGENLLAGIRHVERS